MTFVFRARDRRHLDEILERKGLTLTELAQRVDITIANMSVLRTEGLGPCALLDTGGPVQRPRLPARRSAHLRLVTRATKAF
jgi:hypothetical protein